MPHGDRTGPKGKGSRTGKAKGFCTGSETAGFESIEKNRNSRRLKKGNKRRCFEKNNSGYGRRGGLYINSGQND